MLKESENVLLGNPSWISQDRMPSIIPSDSRFTGTMENATPPVMRPSSPLPLLSKATELHISSPTLKDMTDSFLDSVATAAAVNDDDTIPIPVVTCSPVTANGTNSANEVLDHYSLRWNNHKTHIMHAFDALLQSNALVDVTLVCRERSIHAHKIVLSACSPFFQRVFSDHPCKHPVIVLKDFRSWVVQAIVDFMYRGEISVPQTRLPTLLQAGESLQIRGLVESATKEQIFRQNNQSPDNYETILDNSMYSATDLDQTRPIESCTQTFVSSSSKMIIPTNFIETSQRERERKRYLNSEMDSDFDITEVDNDMQNHRSEICGIHSDICTSPIPRRKQARPRRRSGDFQLSPIPSPLTTSVENSENSDLQLDKAKTLEMLKTVIKTESVEPMDEDEVQSERLEITQDAAADADSGHGNDSRENIMLQDISNFSTRLNNHLRTSHTDSSVEQLGAQENMIDGVDNDSEEPEEYINHSDEMRSSSTLNTTEGPEDLCTTKKDNESKRISNAGETYNIINNNNINQNSIQSSKSMRHDTKYLNKSFGSSIATTNMMLNSFTTSSLRDLRLDRSHIRDSGANTDHTQHKIDALEAQIQAAAAAAVAANCENTYKHMEHQVDLTLVAAAAAVSHHHSREREREQAMQREQREIQQQHNIYANNLLSQMGMSGMPNFGPVPSSSGHDRLADNLNRLNKDFDPNHPLNITNHYNMSEAPPNPSSPLPFPGMSSALALTPPHMFGLDTPLGLFPPGIDPGKLYNPLMDMSDPRGIGPDPPPFLKKKMPRPKGQHSAPRGGPPRSWTNAELTEALQHVWNKKMTTSQASRIFGIPYNSLLMYVRGKYGKSLKLEQLRKDCISGPPLELLQMGMSSNGGSHKTSGNGNCNRIKSNEIDGEDCRRDKNNINPTLASNTNHSLDMDVLVGQPNSNNSGSKTDNSASKCTSIAVNNSSNNGQRNASPDLMGSNAMFNPFQQGFYPDFSGGFPGLPLSMLNLLPPNDGHRHTTLGPGPMNHMNLDDDCRSDRSKQSSSIDDELCSSNLGANSTPTLEMQQPLSLNRELTNEQVRTIGSGSCSRLPATNVQD